MFVAVTRANAIWRVPMMKDGTATKVGTSFTIRWRRAGRPCAQLQGAPAIAHVGLGVVRGGDRLGESFTDRGVRGHQRQRGLRRGGSQDTLHYRSSGAAILRAELDVAGKPMFSGM